MKPSYLAIKDLKLSMLHVNILARITRLSEPTTVVGKNGYPKRLLTATVEDNTNSIDLKIWDKDTSSLRVGDTVEITNAFVTSFGGSLKLNIARYGNIKKLQPAQFTHEFIH